MKIFKKVVSSAVVFSMLLSMIPSFGLTVNAADMSVAPVKEDDAYYYPNGRYTNSYEDRFNTVKQNTQNVKSIGRLPSLDEFCNDTGYTLQYGSMSLTKFREIYHTGTDFSPPASIESIYITNFDEMLLLSDLVGYRAPDETDEEQAYYASAKYEMTDLIDAGDSGEWLPIGTEQHPFIGEFDGCGYRLQNFHIYDSDVEHYGIFGYIGNTGIVRRLVVFDTEISLLRSVGADVGVLCGRNYGQIIDAAVWGGIVEASNATVGGIAAENYGTIINTYANFSANVDNTNGSYSDPQPITAVNSGTLTNCYYIKMEHMDRANELRCGNRSTVVAEYMTGGGWGHMVTVMQQRPYYATAENAYSVLSLDYVKEHHGVYEEDSFTTGKFLSEVNPDHYIGWDSAKLVVRNTAPYGRDRLSEGNTDYHYEQNCLKYVLSNYWNDYVIPSETVLSRPMTWEDINRDGHMSAIYYTPTIYLPQYHVLETDESGNLVDPDAVVMDFIQLPEADYDIVPIAYDLDADGATIPVHNSDGSLRTKTVYYTDDQYRGYVHDDYTGYNGTAVWAEDLATAVDLGDNFVSGSYVYDLLDFTFDEESSDGWYSFDDVVNMINGSEITGTINNDNSNPETPIEGTVIRPVSDIWNYPMDTTSYEDLDNAWWVWCYDENNYDNYFNYYYQIPGAVDGRTSIGNWIQNQYYQLIDGCPDKYSAAYSQAYKNVFSKYFPWLDEHHIDSSSWETDEDEQAGLEAWLADFTAFTEGLFADRDSIYEAAGYEVPTHNSNPYDPYGSYGSGQGPSYTEEELREIRDKNAKFLYEHYKDKGGIPIRFYTGEWDAIADYIAGANSSTDATYTEYERKLFASAHLYLAGYKYYAGYGGTYINDSVNYIIGSDSNFKPIGVADNPFDGLFEANGFTIKIVSSFDMPSVIGDVGSAGQYGLEDIDPFFGVIGENGCVKDLNIVAEHDDTRIDNAYYAYEQGDSSSSVPNTSTLRTTQTASLLCEENRGTIANVNVTMPIALNTFDVGYFSQLMPEGYYSQRKNVHFPANDDAITPDYYIFAQNNSGRIVDCDVDSKFCKFVITEEPDYDSHGSYVGDGPYLISLDDSLGAVPFAKQNTGTIDLDADSGLTDTLGDIEIVKYASERLEYPPYIHAMEIELSSDGKYHISSARDLLYFYMHGQGEKVVLDATIDMSGLEVTQNGHFDLDGTSTDQNDICYDIDLGTGTRCYGIINLNIVSTFSTNQSNVSNVYFIGGNVSAASAEHGSIDLHDVWNSSSYSGCHGTMYVTPLYGYDLFNVHSSATISYAGYSSTTSSPMGYNAELSSYSGDLHLSQNITAAVACVAVNARRCDSYGVLNSSAQSYGNQYISGVAFLANECTSHFTLGNIYAETNDNYRPYIFSIGDKCSNCAIVDDVDYTTWGNSLIYVNYYMFGRILRDCRIGAKVVCCNSATNAYNSACVQVNCHKYTDREDSYYDNVSDMYIHLPAESVNGYTVNGFVVDSNAIISGAYTGVTYAQYVLFEGTANTKSTDDTVELIGEHVDYAVNRGVWNVIINYRASSSFHYGMGLAVNQSEMRANLNIVKDSDKSQVCSLAALCLYGTGYSGYNYTNFVLPFEINYLRQCYVFYTPNYSSYMGPYDCSNFGRIDLNAITMNGFAVTVSGSDGNRNFADIVLTAGYVGTFSIFTSDRSNKNYNYGNITVNLDSDRLTSNYTTTDTDFYQYYDDSSYVSNVKNVYPNSEQLIRIQNVTSSSYISSRSYNTGNIDINLINFSEPMQHGRDNRGLRVYTGTNHASYNYGNITIKGIEANGTPFEGSGSIDITGASIMDYGDIQVSDVKLISPSSSISVRGIDPNNCYGDAHEGFVQSGDVSVINCQAPTRIFVCGAGSNFNASRNLDKKYTVNNNINVKDSKTNNLLVVGGFWLNSADTDKDSVISTNIVIDNVSNQGLADTSTKNMTVAGAVYRTNNLSSGSNLTFGKYSVDGNIELKNITTFGNGVNILPFGYSCGASFDSSVAVNVHDCSFASDLTIQNKIVEYANNRYYSAAGDDGHFINRGNIIVKDTTANALSISGLASAIDSHDKKSLHLNTGSITVDNVDSRACHISGVTGATGSSGSSEINRAEMHNVGAITYSNSVSKNKTISIAGVAATMNTFSGIASNGGKITVDIDDFDVAASDDAEMLIAGVSGSSSNYAVNVINANDIELNAANADNVTVKVTGLITDAKLLSSSVNYGNLDVSVDYENESSIVYVNPICKSVVDSYGWINYGDVNFSTNMPDTGRPYKHFVYLFASNPFAPDPLSNYAINYGNFNYVKYEYNTAASTKAQWIVDLSGNEDVLPDNPWLYCAGKYTDFTNHRYLNCWWKVFDHDDSAFSVNKSSLRNTNEVFDREYLADAFSYKHMFDPAFAFNYDNPLAVKYATANVKEEYYNDNILMDYGYSYMNGLTAAALDSYARAHNTIEEIVDNGFYVVGGSMYSKKTNGVEAIPGRNATDLLVDRHDDVPVSYTKSGITCSDFGEYIDALRQTAKDIGCDSKVYHGASLKSLESYETDSGMSPISSKSSIIKFQAPIDGDKDRAYSEDVLATVIDMYIPIDGFSETSDPFTKDIAYEFSFDDQSYASTFFALKKPIRFNTYDSCAEYLELCLSGEKNLFSTGRSFNSSVGTEGGSTDIDNNRVSLRLPDESGCSYIIGVNKSSTSLEENVIILNLHTVTNIPAAWPVSFNYPVGIASDGCSLIQKSDVFTDRTFDNYKKAADGYTVDLLTVSNSNFTDYEYPEYTLTTNMPHTTDGKYYNSIVTTGDVDLAFDMQNADKYAVYISKDRMNCNSATGFSSDTSDPVLFRSAAMNYDTSFASEDGVYTVFSSGNLSLSDGGVSFLANGTLNESVANKTHTNYIHINENQFNAFLRSGYKYITVGSILDSGEFMPMFVIKFFKEASDENYSRATGFDRVDMFTDDLSSEQDVNFDVIRPGYWKNVDYSEDNAFISTLSAFSDSHVSEKSSSVHKSSNGKTRYPTDVVQTFTVTSESGKSHQYIKNKHLIQLDEAPLLSYTNSSGYASGMNAAKTYESRLFIMDENVRALNLSANYGNVAFSTTTDGVVERATIYSIDVYINDRYVGKAHRWDDGTSSGWSWSYSSGDQYADFNFSISSSNSFYVSNASDFDRTIFNGKVVTFKPVISMCQDSRNYTIALEPISFSAKLLDDSRLISAKWNNALFVSSINTVYDATGESSILSHDVDIDRFGVIDYTNTPDSANHFYILDCVNNNVTHNTLTLKIPRYSTLERLDGSDWVYVDKDTSGRGKVISDSFTYDPTTLGATGYTHRYRVKAQSWLTSAPEVNVTYYDFIVSTTVRNKTINIVFAEDDATTMSAYRDILANDGNAAIQIKNMNADYCRLQQTKLYTDDVNMGSAFYKLTQGDFAIDVKVPAGYTYSVKIVGGSSEGYLFDHDYVKGKRLRLPYRNEQSITLKVYLEPVSISDKWGVVQNRSLFKYTRNNFS